MENFEDAGEAIGVYLHVPFCVSKCSYCHFAIDPLRADSLRRDRYLDALLQELSRGSDGSEWASAFGAGLVSKRHADTLYIGGGTPSLLPPEDVARLIDAVHARFDVADDAEVTLEANPDDLGEAACQALRKAGINRLSIGVQSLDETVLAEMGRRHTPRDVFCAVRQARACGLKNVSLDLILGWPAETWERWARTLHGVEQLAPDHVSVYMLEVEGRNVLAHRVRQGRWTLPDDDFIADLYESTVRFLEERGWKQYEISNFARPGRESRHNLKYWEDAQFLGFGMSAHSYAANRRYWNHPSFGAYCGAVEKGLSPCSGERRLDLREQVGEALMMGLRKTGGVPLRRLRSRYGVEPLELFGEATREAAEADLLVLEDGSLRLTRRGTLLANEALQGFV